MHQFYQNLSNKRGWLLLALLFFFSSQLPAQGLYSNFERLLSEQKSKYNSVVNTLANNNFELSDVKSLDTISLDKTYLNLLIQNTPTRYMLLANNDRCSIYDLMNTDLLKTPGGKIEQVIFNYQSKAGSIEKRMIKKDLFLKVIANKQCPKMNTFKSYFSLRNVRTTLKDIYLAPHKSKDQCLKDILRFQKDLKSPYLCDIVEKIRSIKHKTKQYNNLSKANYKKRTILQNEIKRAKSYKNIISTKAKELLEGHCLNLNNPKRYCADYFKQSFWTKTHLEQPTSKVLNTYCPKKRRRLCISEMNRNPEFCNYAGKQFASLFPKPNCTDISQALLNSRMKSTYQDCPGKTGNDSITTFARVLNHFDNMLKKPASTCELNSTFPFAKASEEYDEFKSWGIKICFINLLDAGKKVCYPTLLGDVGDDPLSLPNTVQKIATRLKGYSGSRCRVIARKEYRPSLLEYRTGCYIIQEREKCYGVSCKFEVVLGETKFENFTIESDLKFNMLPIDFLNENKSMIKLYAKAKKRSLKSIKNISSFLQVFKDKPKAIFLGMGCAEELLPTFFSRRFLNQCRPLPFIVDGYIEKDRSYSLVTRSSLDQIDAPRIIPWTRVFSSLKLYSNLHPTGAWGLYAIY